MRGNASGGPLGTVAAATDAPARVLTIDEVRNHDGPSLILFIGVSTAGSQVHEVFPRWAKKLAKPWILRGVDLALDTGREEYRELFVTMVSNPHVVGAVITSHKLRLFDACADLLTERDPLTDITREINCVAVDGEVRAYARDPLSLSPILDRLTDGWQRDNVLCLGAGGAATALMLALTLDVSTAAKTGKLVDHPRSPNHLTFADISQGPLAALRQVTARSGVRHPRPIYHHLADPKDAAHLVEGLPAHSLIVNATGLGKDRPGTPLPADTRFPGGSLAWDLNYRGDLTFLRQARASGVRVIDGWDYFVSGWTGALSAIAQTPFTDQMLDAFSRAAHSFRP